MKDTYIAAIEIGSSKITGAVGYYTAEGILRILAVEQAESRDSVRYGIIHNPEEVATKVTGIIERLNAHPEVAPRKIAGVYVGLSGRSIRSITSDVNLTFPEEMEISEEIINRLRDDALSIAIDSNMEILSSVARSYHIDGLETASPKGAIGKSISAVFDIIIGRTELKRNIMRSLSERTGLTIKGLEVTALAAADIVLTNEEKHLGCLLVDFGAETTSVSIYKKGGLCHYVTIPLGGRNITRDLTTLSLLEVKAEEIKLENGRAVPRETPSSLNINGIKHSDIINLVVARAEEIVANVIQQIKYAGLTEKDLPGGIVCIGGGSQLNAMLDLLSNQSGMTARYGKLPDFIQPMEPKAKRKDVIETAALLFEGAKEPDSECLELPADESDPGYEGEEEAAPDYEMDDNIDSESKVRKVFRKIGKGFSNIFASTSDEDSELD